MKNSQITGVQLTWFFFKQIAFKNRKFAKEMLQIVNKDIFFRSFFQKLEKKGKIQS